MRLGTASGGEADYRDAYPSAMAVITDNLDALIAHLRWPSEHRKRIRSTDEIVKGLASRGGSRRARLGFAVGVVDPRAKRRIRG
jgi:hypothetical protein